MELELQTAREDLCYVLHYPKGRKYISIFGSAATTEQEREQIKQEILAKLKRDHSSLADAAMAAGEDDEQESSSTLTHHQMTTSHQRPENSKLKQAEKDDSSDSEPGSMEEDIFFLPKKQKV